MTLVDTFFAPVPIAMLGAVLGLDVVSFPQAMVSRPLVAATLAGALIGEGSQGLLVGVALELIAIETLPFGASRYPEWGSAAVVGGALFGGAEPGKAGSMTLAVLAALATAWVGGGSMVALRKLNARWARKRLAALDRGSKRTVIGLQVAGMSADMLRGFLLTYVAMLALNPLIEASLALWSTDIRFSRAVVVCVATMVCAGAIWKLLHTIPGARWLLLGGLGSGLALMRFI